VIDGTDIQEESETQPNKTNQISKTKIGSKFEVYLDIDGQYRFRLKTALGEVVLSDGPYPDKASCMQAIVNLKAESARAIELADGSAIPHVLVSPEAQVLDI
jgi:uncharacterized protein YegP (UPF0339 family)